MAAALATRAAHQLFDALMDEGNGGLLTDADPAYRAVVVRALLIHGARWNEAIASKLGELYGPHGQGKHVERLDNVARLIGYGVPRIDEAMTCTAERATLVGYGRLDGEIRYGLAVTIESEEGVPVYRQIRERLRVRPRP